MRERDEGAPAGRRVTAMDVARAAGVSVSAVSRAFTPGASVSARTRARVMAAAAKLDYMPNALARGLMTQRSNLIGIILTNFKNPLYLSVLDHFTHAIQQRGLRALVFNISRGGDLTEAARQILQYSVDGLIVSAGAISPLLAGQCARRQIPVVAFARNPRSKDIDVVCADNVAGGRMAARLLIERGYRRIGYLGGSAQASTSQDRGKGLVGELEDAGLSLHCSVHASEYSYEAGRVAARALLSMDEPPDALFCANDVLAFGALDVARHRFGLSVPGQLGIVGFDDIGLAEADSFSLTTVRQPIEEMVRETIALMMRRMENPRLEPETRLLSCSLVERGTVRGPRL